MSVNRRSFLAGAIALATTQLLAGCQTPRDAQAIVKFLSNTVPAPMLGEFRRTLERGVDLDFSAEPQLAKLFDLLVQLSVPPEDTDTEPGFFNFDRPVKIPNLVLLGDTWLDKAIAAELIQPLNPETWTHWQDLPQQPIDWNALVRRDESIWAAPYRWGSTVIAYRLDKFEELGWTPQDWSDLWRPELQGHIALLDSPRQTIGLTLKKLGFSYNQTNLAEVPNLETELLNLHRQARLYSSTAYQQPLMRGDIWAAVGYSRDLLAMPQYGKEVAAVVPQSGTSLWSECWVLPVRGEMTQTSDRWIDFCWQPRIAHQLSLLSFAASPVVLQGNRSSLPEGLQTNPVLLPDGEILQRSEFLKLDLGADILEQYAKLWRGMRLA